MKQNAGVPCIEKAEFKIDSHEDNRGLFDGIRDSSLPVNQSSSSIVKILTRYITRKYTDDASIKLIID